MINCRLRPLSLGRIQQELDREIESRMI